MTSVPAGSVATLACFSPGCLRRITAASVLRVSRAGAGGSAAGAGVGSGCGWAGLAGLTGLTGLTGLAAGLRATRADPAGVLVGRGPALADPEITTRHAITNPRVRTGRARLQMPHQLPRLRIPGVHVGGAMRRLYSCAAHVHAPLHTRSSSSREL